MKTVNNPPCPFIAAASTDQRHVDPNAPAPLKADGVNDLSHAKELIGYHTNLEGATKFLATQLLAAAGNKGAFNKIKGLFTQTFVPNQLSGSFLDKELDSGIMTNHRDGKDIVGEFDQKAFDKMFSKANTTEVKVGGQTMRGMTADQLDAFVDRNKIAVGAGKIHEIMARAEMKTLLLGQYGQEATLPNGDKTQVISQRNAEVFYKHGIFPHAELKSQIDAHYPTTIGAELATGQGGNSVERLANQGTKGACPFMGQSETRTQDSQATPNPAFVDPTNNNQDPEIRN